jgi:hypothetical protein
MSSVIEVQNEFQIGEVSYRMEWDGKAIILSSSIRPTPDIKKIIRDERIGVESKQVLFKTHQLFFSKNMYPQFFSTDFLDEKQLTSTTWDFSLTNMKQHSAELSLGTRISAFGEFLRRCLYVNYTMLESLQEDQDLRYCFEECFGVYNIAEVIAVLTEPLNSGQLSFPTDHDCRKVISDLFACQDLTTMETRIKALLLPKSAAPFPSTNNVLAQGLKAKYQNVLSPGSISACSMLIAHIVYCLNAINTHFHNDIPIYYAPYSALIQGSGTGKTKMAFECNSSFILIYICCRISESTGFPMRSPLADIFLTLHMDNARRPDGLFGEERFAVFFRVLFEELVLEVSAKLQLIELTGTNDNGKLLFISHVAESREFAQKVQVAFEKTMVKFHEQYRRNTQQKLQSAVADQPQEKKELNPDSAYFENARLAVAKARQELKSLLHLEKDYEFLFVIDEVSTMLHGPSSAKGAANSFVIWRRSLNYIRSPHWFFLILDTISRVSNLHPSEEKDISGRASRGVQRLFPPFYTFAFTGKWHLPESLNTMLNTQYCQRVHCQPANIFDTIVYNSARSLYEYSRPMFFVAAQAGSFPLLLAMDKLLNNIPSIVLSESDTHEANLNRGMMAALCYRYHLKPCILEDKEELVASHLATLRSFNPKTRDMLVEYIPEPMIGEAAACFIDLNCRDNSVRMFQDLNTLKTMILSSQISRTVTIGDRGEFACIVYALHVFEKAQKLLDRGPSIAPSQQPSKAIQAGNWIATIMETDMESLIDIYWNHIEALRLLNGAVAFTGWYAANTDINRELLMAGWFHRIAFICQRNQEALDVFIPLLLPEDKTAHQPEKKTKLSSIASPQEPVLNLATNVNQRMTKKEGNTCQVEMGEPLDQPHAREAQGAMILPPPSIVKEADTAAVPCKSSSIVVQVKNYTKDIYLSAALKYCIFQRNYAFERFGCGVISVLQMVGRGRVITQKKKTKTVESFSSGLIRLQEYPNDLFLIINGYAGVEPQVQMILKDIATEMDLRHVIQKPLEAINFDLAPTYLDDVLAHQQLTVAEPLEESGDSEFTFTQANQHSATSQQHGLYVGGFACGKSPKLEGVLICKPTT